MTARDFTQVPSIGPATAAALRAAGFDSLNAIVDADLEKLAAVPGVGRTRARNLIAAAAELAPLPVATEPGGTDTGEADSNFSSSEERGASKKRRKQLKAKRKDLRERLDKAVKARSKAKSKKKRRKLKAAIADLEKKLAKAERKLSELG